LRIDEKDLLFALINIIITRSHSSDSELLPGFVDLLPGNIAKPYLENFDSYARAA